MRPLEELSKSAREDLMTFILGCGAAAVIIFRLSRTHFRRWRGK